jgi:hypothetical protein
MMNLRQLIIGSLLMLQKRRKSCFTGQILVWKLQFHRCLVFNKVMRLNCSTSCILIRYALTPILHGYILKTCSQRSYIIRRFRDRGLSIKQLTIIFDAVILSRILYASPAWAGFSSPELIGCIDGFFRRMNRYGYCRYIYIFQHSSLERDETLFEQVRKPGHCLYGLLPPEKNIQF